MRYRRERLNSLIQEEISKIISREVEFDNALATVTKVNIADDLNSIFVGISVIPSLKSGEVLKNLNNNKKQLQNLLLKKINIRSTPRHLIFEIDSGPENAANIEKILLNDNIKNVKNGHVAKR